MVLEYNFNFRCSIGHFNLRKTWGLDTDLMHVPAFVTPERNAARSKELAILINNLVFSIYLSLRLSYVFLTR